MEGLMLSVQPGSISAPAGRLGPAASCSCCSWRPQARAASSRSMPAESAMRSAAAKAASRSPAKGLSAASVRSLRKRCCWELLKDCVITNDHYNVRRPGRGENSTRSPCCMRLFEELDHRETPIGPLSLRRRQELSLKVEVFEIKLGDEFLMSSLFTASEIALAHLGLDALSEQEGAAVVVGGLG